MTGSASPIFDAERRIIAVLDVSSDSFLPPSHTLGMVKMMSQSVENRLILDQFRDTHFQLIFNTGLNNLDSQWAGLLIFDESGRILCANRRADNLLGTRLSGVNIETLFKCPILQLLSETEARPFALHAFGNNRFQCLLKRPTRKPLKLYSVQPVQPAVVPRSLDLEAISLGDANVEKAVLQARRLLEKDIPLLIHGETGVGKEEQVLGQSARRQVVPPLPSSRSTPMAVDLVADSVGLGALPRLRAKKSSASNCNTPSTLASCFKRAASRRRLISRTISNSTAQASGVPKSSFIAALKRSTNASPPAGSATGNPLSA